MRSEEEIRNVQYKFRYFTRPENFFKLVKLNGLSTTIKAFVAKDFILSMYDWLLCDTDYANEGDNNEQ